MYKVRDYSKPHQFPGEKVSPEVKASKEYRIAWNKALYSAWLRNRLNGPLYKDRPSMIKRRLYSTGQQDETQYMKMFLGHNVDLETARKGYMNVNWKVFNIAQKYKKAFIGKFSAMDFAVSLQSRSLTVVNEKDEAMYRQYAMQRIKAVMPDAPGMEGQSPVEPQSLEELKIWQKMGGFSHKVEYAMQELIEAVLAEGWDEKYIEKVLADFWTEHLTVGWDYVDPTTGIMGVKRIDYINALYRTTEDGRVIEGGYLELVPITDLRLTGEYSEKDLQQIAKSAAGSFGNPYQWDYTQDYWAKPSDLGNCPWDDYRVLVLTAEQMSVDNYFYSKNLNKENKPVRREKYGYKSSSSRREAVQEERRNYYQGSWVVGTEFGHGCGPQDTAPRPKLSEARCSLHVIQLDGPSPVEQCEPIFDQVQISWTRYQNNKITAMNSGYAIDEALLVENELGGKMSPAEQIRMARNTGVLLVRSVDARGRSTMSPQSQSIMRMEGGALEAVNEFVTDYNLMVSILGDMTGLTGPAIAQPVDGKKVNELSLEATGTILAPMINGVREIKKSLAKNIILRACLVLKYVDKAREYYTGVLGKDCMDVLMMAVDKNLREYGITVKVTNNSEIIQRLIRSAEMQLEMGRNGQPGLEWIEYAQITRLLIQGASPQYVEALIGRTIDKRKEEMQKAAMEQAKAQPEAQAAAQAQMLQLQMAVEDHKTKNAAELAVTTRAIDYYYTSKENAEAAITAKEQALTDATLETLVAPLLQGAIATAQQRSQMQQPAQ